jgi:pseudaminic acid biosynthesis-associated methylase
MNMNYKSEQENFWANEFGNEYPKRNEGEKLVSVNVAIFSKILKNCPSIASAAELGCNIGLNLIALNRINKNLSLRGYEINAKAAETAQKENIAEVINTTVVESLDSSKKFDLTFTKGVLIHIKPELLPAVYQNMYDLSNRYIMVYEYYNPTPVNVEYRGYQNRLFKRDFAGELIDKYNLKLIDYGFNYKREKYYPHDDATWFLLEK